MAEAIIIEVKGVDKDRYHAVNKILGVDESGRGDWPDGILSHTGAIEGDSIVVFEVWESREQQQEFLNSRLGPALAQAGVPQPSRMEWFSVVGQKVD
jgi:hypothetical protein